MRLITSAGWIADGREDAMGERLRPVEDPVKDTRTGPEVSISSEAIAGIVKLTPSRTAWRAARTQNLCRGGAVP